MHESSIISYTLKSVARIALQNQISEVSEITLTIGKMRMALPAALKRAFDLMTDEAPFIGTKLVINEKDIKIKCNSCGSESLLEIDSEQKCPVCGGHSIFFVQGDELLISSFKGR
ncbi:MAG: hydrogenase maturation nickel metallochaperone HypA [Eubacteriales bacterium]|nr:hydrogenase maturation nickel metallochaperone HypA [Eubacteriales bacterium]